MTLPAPPERPPHQTEGESGCYLLSSPGPRHAMRDRIGGRSEPGPVCHEQGNQTQTRRIQGRAGLVAARAGPSSGGYRSARRTGGPGGRLRRGSPSPHLEGAVFSERLCPNFSSCEGTSHRGKGPPCVARCNSLASVRTVSTQGHLLKSSGFGLHHSNLAGTQLNP